MIHLFCIFWSNHRIFSPSLFYWVDYTGYSNFKPALRFQNKFRLVAMYFIFPIYQGIWISYILVVISYIFFMNDIGLSFSWNVLFRFLYQAYACPITWDGQCLLLFLFSYYVSLILFLLLKLADFTTKAMWGWMMKRNNWLNLFNT